MADIINKLNVGQVVNVKLADNAETNGRNLVDAYNYAKTLTPNGQPLSATNRVALIIMPGNYSLSAELVIDAEFVDVLGLGYTLVERGAIPAVTLTSNTINVIANNVWVQGIGVGTQAFKIGNNKPLQRIFACAGGNESFGFPFDGESVNCSGTFTNCTGGDSSFGGYNSFFDQPAAASGTFINCTAGDTSFGSRTETSGTFTNCIGGGGSFGGLWNGLASGTFTNCIGGDRSFGGGIFSAASGTFTNCIGGEESFGGSDTVEASGTFTNCIGGDRSFGGGVDTETSGTFTNCTGGDGSFGGVGFGSILSGKFYYCRLTSGSFLGVSGGGLMRNCIDGNNNIIDQ